jgi:predicted esterase YcpF (UPF0227 family)
MKIVYIHGWGSSSTGATAIILKEAVEAKYGHGTFIALEYSQKSAEASYKDLVVQIDHIVDVEGQDGVILIGSSLGGFWANWMAVFFWIPCILINPSMQPSLTLPVNVGTLPSVFEDYVEFELSLMPVTQRVVTQRVVILGTADTIVNPLHSKNVFEGKAKIIDLPFAHRFDPVVLPVVLSSIDNINNNFPEYGD